MCWEEGFLHLPRLQMLALEFDYDPLLKTIYQHMLFRCAGFIKEWNKSIVQPDLDNLKLIFHNQPVVYYKDNENYVVYDVNKCLYKQKLKIKYSENVDMIEDLVHSGWI